MISTDRTSPTTLSELLATYLQREGLTLQMFADRAGVSLATVAALRSGTRGKRPHPDTLRKVARAMGVDAQELAAMVPHHAATERVRELELLSAYRQLSDADKARVETYVRALAREAEREAKREAKRDAGRGNARDLVPSG